MGLVDLSYEFVEGDKSNWPGNLPFKKTVVSEDDKNPMSCFIAHVSFPPHFHPIFDIHTFPVQSFNE